jgi:ATP-binding cassette subfamily A (ABC1) protein 3
VPPASVTNNSTTSGFVDDLMDRVLTGVSGTVKKVMDPAQVETECPENFNLLSNCFAAIVFGEIDISAYELVRLIMHPTLKLELNDSE